jgi:hypothetical protein
VHKVDSDIGLSYRPASLWSLAGLCDNFAGVNFISSSQELWIWLLILTLEGEVSGGGGGESVYVWQWAHRDTLCSTATEIPFIYSFFGNSAASAPISTFMCLWAIYIFPGSVYIFPPAEQADPSWEYIIRSQTHECGNWDWGPDIPFLGICVSNFRVFFFAVRPLVNSITTLNNHPSKWKEQIKQRIWFFQNNFYLSQNI